MILSVNSTPAAGYYRFEITPSKGSEQTYRVKTQNYQTVPLKGEGPWQVVAYNGESQDSSETWTVEVLDVLLTTANEVPSFA